MLGINPKHKRILVAMSGGVDSSVVAVLLHRMGYEVIGVTLQLAAPSCGLGACCTGRDLDDVKAMCSQEGFPHHLVLKREEFKEKVINYTVDAYGQGMTPSPCVWCNSKVRFESLFQAMQKYDCDVFVTGHYAYVSHTHLAYTHLGHNHLEQSYLQQKSIDQYSLLSGVDPQKDQSYFLSMLSKDLLPYVQFPLGNMHKTTVRKIARKLGIHVAAKKDSQDLCFVKDTYTQTLWNLKPDIFKPGNIKDINGNILGTHDGVAQYTVGQRKGIGLNGINMHGINMTGIRGNGIASTQSASSANNSNPNTSKSNPLQTNSNQPKSISTHSNQSPLYVIEIDAAANEIIVGQPSYSAARFIHLSQTNLLADYHEGMFVEAKIRARSTKTMARLWNQGTLLEFITPIENVARGQICVMYHGRKVIAAGLINNYTKASKSIPLIA